MDQPEKQFSTTDSLRQDEGFEFELTDIKEARRILDTESMSQFDVASVVPPEQWKRLRRGKLPTDRALTRSSDRLVDGLAADIAAAKPQP